MSTTTTLRQVTLPGQTFTAEGPHDHIGMYVMHHAFRRDLARFIAAARATPPGDAETWRLLHERYQRFSRTLHHHHTLEDEIYWPVLTAAVRQRGDAADLATVTDNSDEHAELDPALDHVEQAVAEMAGHPCEDHRNALDLRLARLSELLLHHMEHEEHEVLPLVQRVMTTEEFDDVEKRINTSYDKRDSAFLVAWVMHDLPADGRERMFSVAGAPYRILHALVRGRFAKREARVFRYAEPGAA